MERTPRARVIGLFVGALLVAGTVLIVLPRLIVSDSPAPPDERPSVAAVLEMQAEAWNRGDLDGYMIGYRDSPDLEFRSGDTVTRGFQPVKERYFKRYKAAGQEMGKLTFRELAVEIVGLSEARVTGKWHLEKTTETLSGGFIVELHRDPAGWKIYRDTTTLDEPPGK